HLAEHTERGPADLARLARSADPRDQRALLELYGLIAAEYEYHPVDPGALPHGEFAVAFARENTGRVLHNYGALDCLERLLEMLHPEGLILVNDYGQAQVQRDGDFEHQRF